MGIQLKNNASGTLATAINASDTGIVLTTGNGASFPSLGASDYFYATLESTGGTFEVIKVTVRSGDSLTVVRAQEGTTAQSFAAGSRIELRVTAQAMRDLADAEQVTYTPPFTGSVTTNVEAKLAQTVSVKDFGAVGDGVTDDSAAIQAALDTLTTGGTLYFSNGTYKLVASGLRVKYDNVTINGYGATLYYPTALPTFADCSSWNGPGGGAAITVAKLNSVQPDPAPGVLPDPGIPVQAATNLITKNFRCFGLRFLSDGDVFANPGTVVAGKGAIYYCNADNTEVADCIFENQHTEPINGGLVTGSSFHDNVFINGQHGGIALVAQENCVIENNRFYDVWQPFETTGIQCVWRGNQIINASDTNNIWWLGTTSRGMGVLDNIIEDNYCNASCNGNFVYFEYAAGGANTIKRNIIRNNKFIDAGAANHQYMTLTCKGAGRAYDITGNTFDARGAVSNGSVLIYLDDNANDIVFKQNSLVMVNSPVYFVQLQGAFNAGFLCENNVATFPYGNYFATATEGLDVQNGWARFPHFYNTPAVPQKLEFLSNRVNSYDQMVMTYATMTPGASCLVSSNVMVMTGNDGVTSYDIGRFYGSQPFVLTNNSGLNGLIRHNATYLIMLSGSNTTLTNGASMYFVPIGDGSKYKQIA